MSQRTRVILLSGIMALAAMIFYLLTLAPTITWRNRGIDSGDLAAAVAVMGVPHPPGYPAYLLLGWGWENLPWGGDVAYRLNLFSAVMGALVVGMLAWTIYTLASNDEIAEAPAFPVLSGVWGAGLLATSSLFWSQAVITEVYAPGMALLGGLIILLISIRRQPALWKFLLAGMGGGVAFGLWPLILWLLLPPFLYLTWTWTEKGFSEKIKRAILFFAGISLMLAGQYLFLYMRAITHPLVNWLAPTNLPQLWSLATAQIYHRYFQLPWRAGWAMTWMQGLFILAHEIGLIGSIVAIVGLLVSLLHRRFLPHLFLWGLGFWLILASTVFFASYQTRDHEVYLLPGLYGMALLSGWSLSNILKGRMMGRLSGWMRLAAPLLIIVVVLIFRINATLPQVDLHHDQEAWRFARETLIPLPQNTILVTRNDAQTFSLWYAQTLGVREDIIIIDERLLTYPWYQEELRRRHPHLQPAAAVRPGGLTALSQPIFLLPQDINKAKPIEISH